MKKLNYILSAFILFLAFSACKPKNGADSGDNKDSDKLTFPSAVEYNDFIISQQENIVKSLLSLADAMNAGVNDDIKSKYELFGKQCKKSLDTIKKMDSYNNDTAFRDESIKLFQFYYDIYQKDYKEMVDIIIKGDKIDEKDMTRLEEIKESITKRENERDGAFADAQNKFAKENNMQIIPNDLQKDVNKP